MRTLVISQDKRIVINKFVKGLLLSLLVWGLTAFANFMNGGGLPVAWGFWIPFILDIVATIKKALDSYKPELANGFKWFYEPFIRFIELLILKIQSKQ